MTIDMSQFYQVFFEETAEHLANMESLLLGLDVQAPSLDDLNAIFRAAHSIKGGSGTFGFSDMTEVTHILETLLDKLRKQELALRPEMVDAFLAAGDVLQSQLQHHQGGDEPDEAQVREVCARLAVLSEGEAGAAGARKLRLECVFPAELVADAATLENLLAALGELAECRVIQRPVTDDPRLIMGLSTPRQDNEIRDALSFYLFPEDIVLRPDDGQPGPGAVQEPYGLFDEQAATPGVEEGFGFFDDAPGSPAVAQPAPAADTAGFGFFDDAPGAPAAQAAPASATATAAEGDGFGFFADAPGAPAPAVGAPAAPVVAAAVATVAPATPAETPHPMRRASDKAPAAAASESSIRVAVEKVDQLINLVGELVITQAMIADAAGYLDPVQAEKLISGIDLLSRNTRDLQEAVMSIRMLPMSMVFSRFPRVVRDVAGKLQKQVELKTVGESTELDKGLIEKITDPLTHLIRNSLDHGIETPEKRLAAGKPAKGTLTLKAAHQSGNIIIEVIDDGAGLNRSKILSKAKERGLPVHDGMSDSDVWQLIFAPGFSTADQITDVSGRGVGMDVVKKNIEGVGGKVELESIPGHGTRTVIRLPLTLAILDGMSVGVAGETFILPLTAIIESLQPTAEELKTMAGDSSLLHIRGEYLPLIPLADVLGLSWDGDYGKGIVMVVEAESGKAALFVDELLGQHQVVIKSLEANYRKIPGISGATIMGDGSVALILDLGAIIRSGLENNPGRKAA